MKANSERKGFHTCTAERLWNGKLQRVFYSKWNKVESEKVPGEWRINENDVTEN